MGKHNRRALFLNDNGEEIIFNDEYNDTKYCAALVIKLLMIGIALVLLLGIGYRVLFVVTNIESVRVFDQYRCDLVETNDKIIIPANISSILTSKYYMCNDNMNLNELTNAINAGNAHYEGGKLINGDNNYIDKFAVDNKQYLVIYDTQDNIMNISQIIINDMETSHIYFFNKFKYYDDGDETRRLKEKTIHLHVHLPSYSDSSSESTDQSDSGSDNGSSDTDSGDGTDSESQDSSDRDNDNDSSGNNNSDDSSDSDDKPKHKSMLLICWMYSN